MLHLTRSVIVLLILQLIVISSKAFPQTLGGMEGLITIPSAYMNKDATIALGAGYLNKIENPFRNHKIDGYTYTAWFTFLPFFEVGVRILRNVGKSPSEGQGIGDRTISLRLQLFKGDEYLPSFLVGIQNFGSVNGGWESAYDQSTYVVMSKKIIFNKLVSFNLHIGYGSDIVKAQNHKFNGIFGGTELSIDLLDIISINYLFEYDSDKVNSGTRVRIDDSFYFLISFFQLKYFGGSFGIKYVL